MLLNHHGVPGFICASLLLIAVSACNTIEGAGEDLEEAGDEIEQATDS